MGNSGAVALGFEKAPQTLEESMDGLTKLVSAHLSSRLRTEASPLVFPVLTNLLL